MVSAKDSFHKFEYDLWQNDAGQYKNLLTPGLTTTVANYFLGRQDAILLHDRGRLIGLGRGGGPPFSNEQFKLSDERLVSRNYNLILVGDPLQEGLFSVDDRKAIISAFLWHQDSKVKLTHYFAFIVSVAILKYHIPELARHEGEDSCAFSDASSSIDIARMLARGGLCLECQDAIDRFMSRGALDPTLVDSITALQLSLANEYRVRPDRVSDTPPDTSQQTHEVKVQGQVGVEYTDGESVEEPDAPPLPAQPEAPPTEGVEPGTAERITDLPSEGQLAARLFGVSADVEAPEDALDYREYAKSLAAIICDRATEMPFTLGICAPWGRGKTALMNFVKDEIKVFNEEVKKSWTPRDLDQRRATVIDFNAWQFSRAEQVWSGFITTIMRKLEEGLYGFEEKLRMAWELNKSRDLPVIYNLAAFIASVIVLAVLAVVVPKEWLVALGLVGVGSVAFYRKVFRGAWKLATSPAAERISQLSKLPDYASRLDPIHRILKDIKTITKVYRKGYMTSTVDRFVVFIDDIDRCEPDKIMETLEAIKHLLDLKRFVFVIAMDTRVVRFAIGEHYKFMCKTAKEREEMGRFYLEKMIQVPFHLPALSAEKRIQLNQSIVGKHLVDESLETTLDRVTEADEPMDEAAAIADSGHIDAGPMPIPSKLDPEEEPTETPGAEVPAPALFEDNPTKALRLRITNEENEIINAIMKTKGFDISPRLIKRFVNVYLMARLILMTELAKKQGTGSGFVPYESFIKWIAVSVLHPFEAVALERWLAANSWADPFDVTSRDVEHVFRSNGQFRYKERPDGQPTVGRAREDQAPFDRLKLQDLNRFGFILSQWDMDWTEVKDTLHITNCFNLVLE